MSSLFRDVTQLMLIVLYRCFGTAYRSNLQGSGIILGLNDPTVWLNVGKQVRIRICCITSHNSEGRNHTVAQASNLVNCWGMLNIYTFKTCTDVQYPFWEWSGFCMHSRGRAIRFPTEPRDFPTIVKVQNGYAENTHAASMTIAGFSSGIKWPGHEVGESTSSNAELKNGRS